MTDGVRRVRKLADRATLGIIAVLLMLGGRRAVSAILQRQSLPSSKPLIVRAPSGTVLSRAAILDIAKTGVRVGDVDPAVTVIAYIDYNCAWCAKLDSDLVSLLRRYPDHLAVVYKDFVTESDPIAMDVQVAARCAADQSVFPEYHEALFRQMSVAHARNGWKTIARSIHMPDLDRFEHCVLGDEHRAEVAADSREARRLGFTATPSGIIGSQVFEGTGAEGALDSIIVRELMRATRPNAN